jgi:hypothetical protein
MGGLFCPLCGETLPQAGLHCPTCSHDVGWWLIQGLQAEGPLELRELRDAWARGRFDAMDWICLGDGGLRHKPDSIAQILRGSDYPKWGLIEDWTDVRNLFRWAVIALLPLIALIVLMLYWLKHWPGK